MMKRAPQWKHSRSGFTLIELLMVMGIISLILAMTAWAVNYAQDADRIRGAASQIQSFLGGAQDRAIALKKPVGVRLFLDRIGDQTTVSSMAWVAAGEKWSEGTIQLQRWDVAESYPDGDGQTDPGPVDIDGDGLNDDPADVWVVAGIDTGWWEMKRRGLLVDGLRIRIPKGQDGTWYPISTELIDVTQPPGTIQKLRLGIPYADPGETDTANAQAFESGGEDTYELELPASIMPLEPLLLPDDTVIDLAASRIPAAWGPWPTASGGTEYSRYMDIMFSPTGGVLGTAAAAGIIHLYVGSRVDALTYRDYLAAIPASPNPAVPPDVIGVGEDGYPISDRRLVTIFTQTGSALINLVNPEDTLADGVDAATDPYLFAEVGSEAN